MIDPRLKELRGTGRRDFLRWSATVAAALGLERARLLNILNDTAGSAAADTAACATTRRFIHLRDGNGGLSNWTQLFPFPKVISSTNAQYSHYALGKGVAATGYDHPWMYAPDSPWQTGSWKMTAFLAGNNETHTQNPVSTTALGANTMLASAAAIQQANPTLLPVLTVGGITFGTAPGAPAVAAVNASAQLVDLFNSAASRALLSTPENGALAEAYYKAFIGLNAAAGRTTMSKQYGIGKVSMNLLAKNLSTQLTPTATDLTTFGVDGTTPAAVANGARAFITTLKAFGLGLTSMMVYSGLFRDDPHGAFANGDAPVAAKAMSMGKALQGIYDLAKTMQDPSCSARTLADSIVFSIDGDTMKAPFNRNGWGDGTPMGSNMLYVMGNGYLKTGLIGDMDPTAGATAWDPATGNAAGSYAGKGAMLGSAASAAVLYAIAKGDMRRVRDFYNGGAIDGVVNLNVTG
jgi:hypothetical protein